MKKLIEYILDKYPQYQGDKDVLEELEEFEVYTDDPIEACFSKHGFNDEIRTDCYFNEDKWMPEIQLRKGMLIEGISFYYLYDDFEEEIIEVYCDLEAAMTSYKKYEETAPLSIEEEIEAFLELLLERENFDVQVKKEINSNSGYYHTFNIYMDGLMMIDGVFKLDEELAEELNTMNELVSANNMGELYVKYLDKESAGSLSKYKIESIYKDSDSWDKLYIMRVSRDLADKNRTFTTQLQFDIVGCQGSPRNVVEYILKNIDVTALEDEYNEWVEGL